MTERKKYQNYLDQKSPEQYPWAWAIINRRDLESDCYEGFTLELIDMVRIRAKELVQRIHLDAAVTPKTKRAIRDMGHMIDEALLMAKLSPKVATRGTRWVEVDTTAGAEQVTKTETS